MRRRRPCALQGVNEKSDDDWVMNDEEAQQMDLALEVPAHTHTAAARLQHIRLAELLTWGAMPPSRELLSSCSSPDQDWHEAQPYSAGA